MTARNNGDKTYRIEPKEGLAVVVSGPSGVGKNSVITALRERYGDVRHSVSMTTRKPRPGEIDGIHYLFKTREEFERLIAEGEILEYDLYCGEYYGTPLAPLMKMRRDNVNVMLDLTVKGALALKAKDPRAILIFLIPPSEGALRERLAKRGTEDPATIEQRLGRARHEMTFAPHFDYVVINDTLPEAVRDIEAVIWSEKHRIARVFIDGITG